MSHDDPHRLFTRSGPRNPGMLPRGDDDALGHALFGRLGEAIARGLPRPVVLVLQERWVDQVDIVPILSEPAPARERFLSALCGAPDAECSALVGVMRLSRPGRPRAGIVYLEWPDNRWWTAYGLLGEDSRFAPGAPHLVRRAVDGWPRPGGVGGWFARARREGLRLDRTMDAPQGGLGLVH